MGRGRFLSNLGPWGGSAIAHAVILMILLLWTIPIIQHGSLRLIAFTGVDDGDAQELAFALEETLGEDLELDEVDPMPPTDFSAIDSLVDGPAELNLEFETPPPQTESVETVQAAVEPNRQSNTGGGAVSEANSVEAAVDQITGGIRGRLENGDVLVVWLLDASLSLQDDRNRVANRLSDFLEEFGTSYRASDDKPRLLNAVSTFGRVFKEAIKPTQSGKPVLHSIRNAAIDKSGVENVFQAVQQCVAKYRQHWKSQMMIVIWTDESGDDVNQLSRAIAMCKKGDVAVSVVGPSAVLGADTALHDFVEPKTKFVYQLPIRKGPDSAMPERIRLSYWFRGPPPREVRRSSQRLFPIWYGNDDMIGLTSSFSPHALSRLAMQTGGSFTVFDRAEDRAPYDAERMMDYRPRYESTQEYRKQFDKYPLRRAVHSAVKATYSDEIDTPDLMFFGQRAAAPPHEFQALYFTPAQFQSRLRSAKTKTERKIKHINYAIERALAFLSDKQEPGKGLEYEYNNEPSMRWRAWYDLSRGRLLAVSVRLEEYRLAWEQMLRKDFLRPDTNGIIFGPSTEMRSSGIFTRRAQEAERLLTRCLEDHADTPWAYLAQRELNHGLGIYIKQMSFTAVQMKKGGSGPKLPSF